MASKVKQIEGNNFIEVEYIIISTETGSFCNTEDKFLNFLSSESRLTISPQSGTSPNTGIITFIIEDSNFDVNYLLFSGLIPNKRERYFKLSLSTSDITRIDDFDKLTKVLSYLFKKIHPQVSINELWNEIARGYAIKGYEAINKVENYLRRFISDFMLINVGYEWPKLHVPNTVLNRNINNLDQDSIEDGDSKINSYTDYLHQTYFSDLVTILFTNQQKDILELESLINTIKKEGKSEIPIARIEEFVPTTLWDKYFSSILNINEKQLKDKLEILRKLRNNISHNRHISKDDLLKATGISNEVVDILKRGIKNLSKVIVTKEDREILTETENTKIVLNQADNQKLDSFDMADLTRNHLELYLNQKIFATTSLSHLNKNYRIFDAAGRKTIGLYAEFVNCEELLTKSSWKEKKDWNKIQWPNFIDFSIINNFYYYLVIIDELVLSEIMVDLGRHIAYDLTKNNPKIKGIFGAINEGRFIPMFI